MSVINQKEYLKRYLNIGKSVTGEKKKNKKKIKRETCRLKIIDDNDDTFNTAVQEDLLGETDDAPQIVEVIDDRPPSLRIDEKSKSHLWIPIGSNIKTCSYEDMSLLTPKIEQGVYPPRSRINEDTSPLKVKLEEDMSPPRKKIDRDISPPRRKMEDVSPAKRKSHENTFPLTRKEIGRDISPLRRKVDKDMSPPRRKVDEDMSPPRRKVDDYISPPTKIRQNEDMSPPRRNRKIENVSSVEVRMKNDKQESSRRNKPILNKYSRWDSENPQTKTLDGKTAGLQNAKDLVAEIKEINQREEEHFKNLSNEVSGLNAHTIVRNKKTGKIRNFVEEAENNLEMLKKKIESEEKYSRWGKGLKQVEDAMEKRADALNEMNKPLARYADDEDLERYLKEQEREGDPMLAYIRKKKKKQDIDEGKPMKPEYMGEFMPNRFGIRPGHRWDGVDRSNGYEKRWFEVQNSRLAEREESYKWNTEDM